MGRDSGGRRDSGGHFAHWFLHASAYDSWHGLEGWFEPPPEAEVEPTDEEASEPLPERRRAPKE